MSVNIIANISWAANPTLLPTHKFRIKIPPGLAAEQVRQPNFVDPVGMQNVSRKVSTGGSQGGFTGSRLGLVTREIRVQFENAKSQWRCTPQGGSSSRRGPASFQFQGGNIFVELALGIYILNGNQPNPQDQASIDIFSVIYSHELLHVADELDILKNWTLPKLLAESIVAQYLVKAQPYIFGKQTQDIFQVEREFRFFIQNKIETLAYDIWAEESNRRENRRDSPAEYKIVQEQVNTLRQKQVNSP